MMGPRSRWTGIPWYPEHRQPTLGEVEEEEFRQIPSSAAPPDRGPGGDDDKPYM
jgi:hypothetical protein